MALWYDDGGIDIFLLLNDNIFGGNDCVDILSRKKKIIKKGVCKADTDYDKEGHFDIIL